ncbi:RNA polymerase sigma factor [Paenibacillus sp. M1]|uniref:RNA polymerase sigma factor n=1 Tax=Paenibacillus haidiansis TaxID=1574488 RepID=A0ABU7VYV3_9BACL
MRQEELAGKSAAGKGKKQAEISAWFEAHQQSLRQYCRALAGSPWEGDDLAQETWLKVWSTLLGGADSGRFTQAYLYRVARNAWIDRNRKKSIPTIHQPLDAFQHPDIDSVEIWGAMELLVQNLAPAQRTALLLVDVLKYTAAEAAELIHSTEGAVKAALHRARVKLQKTIASKESSASEDQEERQEYCSDREKNRRNSRLRSQSPQEADRQEADYLYAYAYLEAFRTQNTAAMVLLMNDGAPEDAAVSLLHAQPQARQRERKASRPAKMQSLFMQLAA